mgnify:CR=1 FL=1|tara:strand:- start:3460 stop:3834 length:375 start_codon:yes stop_codon:yes gene_type:complete
MSIFRKGGLKAFGRNLFKKQATGVNKIFSKISEGANFLQQDKIKNIVNSPVLDVIAAKTGNSALLNSVRRGYGQVGNVKKFADVGAELGSIGMKVEKDGVDKNTIERLKTAGKSIAGLPKPSYG